MADKNLSFSGTDNGNFLRVLNRRVDEHLKLRKCTRYGNSNMVIKTILMFSLYFTPFVIMLCGIVTHPVLMMSLWIVMGLGMAGIGLCVMHDANHGSYSPKSWKNKWLGYSLNLVGGNARIWKLQHNVLHHGYTNIHGSDDDIHTPKILRFSPHGKKYWIHKFQYFYSWFFYGISTLAWVTTKEYLQAYRYKQTGLIKGRKKFRKLLIQLTAWKLLYYSYILVLPILLFTASPWFILLCFIAMHFTTGLILSLIFVTAHLMPDCKFPVPDEHGTMATTWVMHEMMTTSNYSPSSKVFSWLIGGLNYQIEHHLLPNVCHVHYKRISAIVSATALEFGLPYNTQKTFLSAIWNHMKMLYKLGRWTEVDFAQSPELSRVRVPTNING